MTKWTTKIKRFALPSIDRRFLLGCAITAVAAFLFFRFIFAPAWVRGGSMAPTYDDGDFVLYMPWLRYVKDPQPQDIVLIRMAGRRIMLLKRVIATAGQTVEFHNGTLLVDGKVVKEPYVVHDGTWSLPPRVVDSGHVYVVGDNRDMGIGEHHFGQTPINRIHGYPLW